ncbi:MAG: 4Fe-4S binding protein [Methanobacteriaceae archaeon]|jgi:4Fe-4S ferredoxin|nr:4Fe-4S binding protein [Methanobacteriaceae archaeon]
MASVLRDGNEKRELTHNNEKCVGCGICTDICPTSALKLGPVLPVARGLLEKDLIKINGDKCVLCGLCASSCPFDALDFEINGENIRNIDNYPKWDCGTNINEDDCIYCGKCEISCPQDAINMKRNLPELKELVRGETRTFVDKCISCHFCEDMCPSGAITIKAEENDEYTASAIEIDDTKCMYCKICQKVCPEDAIQIICATCMESEFIPTVNVDGEILLNDDLCVNCSWCENVCPTDAPKTIKPFKGTIIIDESEKECKGESCQACVDVCPCNAISMVDGKASIDEEFCILCGACEKICPVKIISVTRTSMNLDNIKSQSWKNVLGKIISK